MALRTTKKQAATMSLEAVKYLAAVPHPWIPGFLLPALTGLGRMPPVRKAFQAGEDVSEESLIARSSPTLEKTTIKDVPVLIIRPRTITPDDEHALLLNIHGGGFVMGTARERTALLMAAEIGITVYSIDYTLAPEAKYPPALNQCFAVYEEVVTHFDPKQVVGVSSSSGGALMLAVVLKAQKLHLPMIKALGMFSPAGEISGVGDSAVSNNRRDVQSADMALAIVRQNYVGDMDPRDPGISPLSDTFATDFPPTMITTGTRDIMLSNGVRLFWKLKEINVPVELLVSEGMWHGFNWEPDLPEAIRTRKIVVDFLNSQIRTASREESMRMNGSAHGMGHEIAAHEQQEPRALS